MSDTGEVSAALLPLLRELGDLKRITCAGRTGSIATRLFAGGWSALADGAEPASVMRRVTATALAAARLGGLDAAKLTELGLARRDVVATLTAALDQVAGPLHADTVAMLKGALAEGAPQPGRMPAFVAQLAMQPRAGVTCPGRPRVILQPAENHAEHCLMVAVYGVLMAPGYGADSTSVFVASMAHHFHNATMPDAGFSGEVLLGDRLDAVIARARDACLAQLDPRVAETVRTALAPIGGDATAEARAFHAADVIDRVLEIEQHLTRSSLTMTDVLDTYGLVHEGPVKPFHDRVLTEVGLG